MNRFIKYAPSHFLKPFIQYFAISEHDQERTYKVIPGTALVLGFQYRGGLSKLEEGATKILSTAGITGIQERCSIFKNSENIGTILVYFKETAASFFFRNPIHELFSESRPLDFFIRQSLLEKIQEQLSEASGDQQKIDVIESFLASQLQFSNTDLLVTTAIQKIYQSRGNIKMKWLAENLFISQSPFEKRFRKMVGSSPKKFASIVRLQSVLLAFSSAKSLTETAYEFGYFDQAHFIKDFKMFTGETPERYLLKK
jgi:AraC-like DNA-binding protein